MFNRKPQPKPLFCRFCGKKLVPNVTIVGYDELTGDPIQPFLNKNVCPDKNCKTYWRDISDYS